MIFNKIEIKIKNSVFFIFAASVRGEGKLENQDSFDYYYDDNQIIIALADGLGSAVYSKEGSSKAVKILIDIIKENVESKDIPLMLLNRWKKAVGGNFDLYNTTIKFIHIEENKISYGGVGDGWIAFNTGDGLVDLCAENSFSNQTDSILSFDLKNKFIYRQIKSNNILNMLISTDGFSEDIDKEKGKAFLDAVRKEVLSDSEAFWNEFKCSLCNWPVQTNKDDKTAIFIIKSEV